MKSRYRYETGQRRARRVKAIVRVPKLDRPETWLGCFAGSIGAFSGLDAAAKIELARRLIMAIWNLPFNASTLDLTEKERKAIKTMHAKLDRMRRRNPAIGYAADCLEPLTAPRHRSVEGHVLLLNRIFEIYSETLAKYPECGFPEIDQFTDAVLADLGLGQIDDDNLIGVEDFRGAYQRWLATRTYR